MKDSLTSQNHQDFRQRYAGTYGWLLQGDKKTFVNILAVDHRAVRFVNSKGQDLIANADGGIDFEFIPVNRGWFNTRKGIYYLFRHPARQFNRGISNQNTGIRLFLDEFPNQLSDSTLTMKVLSDIFEKGISYEEAWDQAKNKLRSHVAISRHFAINMASGSVYFDNQRCGDYSANSAAGDTLPVPCIKLTEPSISQEIRDALRRINADVQVLQ